MGHTPYPGLSLRGWGPGRLWLARLGYEFSLFSPGVRLLILTIGAESEGGSLRKTGLLTEEGKDVGTP